MFVTLVQNEHGDDGIVLQELRARDLILNNILYEVWHGRRARKLIT